MAVSRVFSGVGFRAVSRYPVIVCPDVDREEHRYNFVRHELFVPANLEIGKSWGRLVASLEGAVGVIKGDDPIYKWKFEGRLGNRF